MADDINFAFLMSRGGEHDQRMVLTSLELPVAPVMKYVLKCCVLLWVFLSLVYPVLVQAGVVVRGSRVIYNETQGEVVVQLRKAGADAALIQVWLDSGDDSLDAHLQPSPFMITPSVVRMDPDAGQSIRVRRVDDILPKDRESLLFFNVLEIPPMPTEQIAAGDNYIQFSSRVRLKFFYRPKGLPLEAEKAHQLLRFSRAQGEGGELQVQVHNPSPYHVTFKTLVLRNGSEEGSAEFAQLSQRLGVNETTVAPISELLLPMDTEASALPASGLDVRYEVVGDYGNIISGQRSFD